MKHLITSIALGTLLAAAVSAAEVQAVLSSREAYVGSPVTLQLSISNASDYEPPTLPTMDGCDIRPIGSPSQSSQITIINGRRTASHSVTMHYQITPRREGTFTIPPLVVNVDGKSVMTKAQRFVATKSETGDLLFVDIEGGKEKVYVGEPLDLKLKIWIKPFRDPKSGTTLSEGDMWNMLSDSTSWGGFADRMQELQDNNRRPGGDEVLRDDGNGIERAYYLYEIDATIYPKRAGKIDASDVQVVVNYPTAIGKTRSPFAGLMDDDMFGGNSPLSRMMNDDFFASPFGNRLAVIASRPIVGSVSVDATEVQSVPTVGRPADYRGAVGRYRIAAQATPTSVAAGDPITLNLGITGTGPMELVQAPPLHELSELTKDFKVADDSLAGFVKDDTKLFSTTIRPRHEGISEIPAIRFSFFDPENEQFQTVTSEPIAITVNKAETLALDAIVGGNPGTEAGASERADDKIVPDFTNHGDSNVLISQVPHRATQAWWAFVVVPPIVWLAAVGLQLGRRILRRLPSFRSPKFRCLAAIDRAPDQHAIFQAVIAFVLARCSARKHLVSSATGTPAKFAIDSPDSRSHSTDMAIHAIGSLRIAGLYEIANEVESFFTKRRVDDLATTANLAKELVNKLDDSLNSNRKSHVKTTKSKEANVNLARPIGVLLAWAVIATASNTVSLAEIAPNSNQADLARISANPPAVRLDPIQQKKLLAEATTAYNQGTAKSESDSAVAKEFLAAAADKYQLLVDSGIRSGSLYTNLGNAYLQTGKIGLAIANYEKAKLLDPSNSQILNNLAFAETKISRSSSVAMGPATTTNGIGVSWVTSLRRVNRGWVGIVGMQPILWILALSSTTFWGLLTVRLFFRSFSVWKYATGPLVALILSLGSVALIQTSGNSPWNAVVIADKINLRSGDGDHFDQIVAIDSAQGQRVEVLTHRGSWMQIRTADGHQGWVPGHAVEQVSSI